MRLVDKLRSLFKGNKDNAAAVQLLENISQQLEILSHELSTELQVVASGQKGLQDTVFDYIIMDRSGGELQTEWQDSDYITLSDIQQTTGYHTLQTLIQTEGLQLELLEEQVEEVDDEERVRFIIRITGWSD